MSYSQRRTHLADLSEKELEDRFWQLAEQVTAPLVDLARTHTSPSIERSVLLRMGFDSLEAGAIVKKAAAYGLLGRGVGNIVVRYGEREGLAVLDAGRTLARLDNWDDVKSMMSEEGDADA